ncbi:hypothetical protein C7M84_018106 [Penaeus vannamei]|uniref:Uncharacterized protein n=1 Tax=Penaeus vannamei TaxID=6689 RepID=A0A423SIE6_PENVA|nr:hypothetical protein C7M84_018106 [Penaeus vannamei]
MGVPLLLSARSLSQHDRKQGPLLRHAQGGDALRTPHHPRPGKRLALSRVEGAEQRAPSRQPRCTASCPARHARRPAGPEGGQLRPAPAPGGPGRARLAAFQPSPARSAGGGERAARRLAAAAGARPNQLDATPHHRPRKEGPRPAPRASSPQQPSAEGGSPLQLSARALSPHDRGQGPLGPGATEGSPSDGPGSQARASPCPRKTRQTGQTDRQPGPAALGPRGRGGRRGREKPKPSPGQPRKTWLNGLAGQAARPPTPLARSGQAAARGKGPSGRRAAAAAATQLAKGGARLRRPALPPPPAPPPANTRTRPPLPTVGGAGPQPTRPATGPSIRPAGAGAWRALGGTARPPANPARSLRPGGGTGERTERETRGRRRRRHTAGQGRRSAPAARAPTPARSAREHPHPTASPYSWRRRPAANTTSDRAFHPSGRSGSLAGARGDRPPARQPRSLAQARRRHGGKDRAGDARPPPPPHSRPRAALGSGEGAARSPRAPPGSRSCRTDGRPCRWSCWLRACAANCRERRSGAGVRGWRSGRGWERGPPEPSAALGLLCGGGGGRASPARSFPPCRRLA